LPQQIRQLGDVRCNPPVQARAIREKTAHLKALRLAKEAQAQNEEPPAKA
jgi:hypothetical protein